MVCGYPRRSDVSGGADEAVPGAAVRGLSAGGQGYPPGVTTPSRVPQVSQQELYRYLEDRFACAQACAECSRACAVRASLVDPGDGTPEELVRRKGVICAEVCDATSRVLSEDSQTDEATVRAQVEWCRQVCAEAAHAFDGHPGAERTAEVCRACARACTDFLGTLTPSVP